MSVQVFKENPHFSKSKVNGTLTGRKVVGENCLGFFSFDLLHPKLSLLQPPSFYRFLAAVLAFSSNRFTLFNLKALPGIFMEISEYLALIGSKGL